MKVEIDRKGDKVEIEIDLKIVMEYEKKTEFLSKLDDLINEYWT